MIKAAIKSVVSHPTVAHVLTRTGCARDRVVMAGFTQNQDVGAAITASFRNHLSSADGCLQSRRKGSTPDSPICVFYLVALSATSEFIMVLYYFLPSFRVSALGRNLDFLFFFFIYTNKLPSKTNTEELIFRVLWWGFFLLSAACTNNEIFNWTFHSMCIFSN